VADRGFGDQKLYRVLTEELKFDYVIRFRGNITVTSGRDFAAFLGLTPRQNSSGGKQTLGGITKQGNRYIRKMLVLGATSLLNVLGKRKGALRDWIVGLLAKKPARLVTVALANKLARILWAMMKTGECFRTEMFAKA